MELKKKIFIAMAGNIGAGKTTAAKLLSQHFGLELFDEPVIDNRFLRDDYAEMRRWSFRLPLEFLMRRVEHHELIRTVPQVYRKKYIIPICEINIEQLDIRSPEGKQIFLQEVEPALKENDLL